MSDCIILKLTKAQARALVCALYNYRDEGPCGAMWPSKEVKELRKAVGAQIDNQRKKEGLKNG